MARVFARFLTKFTCQSSVAITADADAGGTKTDFDTTASGNLDGCKKANIEIDVTTPPSSEALCYVYLQALEFDGAGYSAKEYAGMMTVGTTASKYSIEIDIPYEKGQVVLHAVNFGFTASAELKGIYFADA